MRCGHQHLWHFGLVVFPLIRLWSVLQWAWVVPFITSTTSHHCPDLNIKLFAYLQSPSCSGWCLLPLWPISTLLHIHSTAASWAFLSTPKPLSMPPQAFACAISLLSCSRSSQLNGISRNGFPQLPGSEEDPPVTLCPLNRSLSNSFACYLQQEKHFVSWPHKMKINFMKDAFQYLLFPSILFHFIPFWLFY